MKKPDRDEQFISGIHNYCDRWCERCAFTARCQSYAMEREQDERSGPAEGLNDAFWKRLETSLQNSKDMITRLAQEQGISPDSLEAAQIGHEEDARQEAAESHPLAQAAMRYSEMVEEWFTSSETALRDREEEFLAQARLGIASVNEEVASITDVVEILRWYQDQIYVKLVRSLESDPAYEAESRQPKDSDGSAKVALIAMDRSIAAWLRMKDFFPDQIDSVLNQLVHLDRLRQSVEKQFPNARSFIRPGFDTGDSPVPPGAGSEG